MLQEPDAEPSTERSKDASSPPQDGPGGPAGDPRSPRDALDPDVQLSTPRPAPMRIPRSSSPAQSPAAFGFGQASAPDPMPAGRQALRPQSLCSAPTSYPPALEAFEVRGDLGEGSFALVKTARLKSNGQRFALKIMEKSPILSRNLHHQVYREVQLQSRCRHKNILRLHDFFEDPAHLYMLLEYAQHGTLPYLVRTCFPKRRAPEPARRVVLEERLLVEDRAGDVLVDARRREEEVAPRLAVRLRVLEADGLEALADGARRLVAGQEALAGQHHGIGGLDELVRVLFQSHLRRRGARGRALLRRERLRRHERRRWRAEGQGEDGGLHRGPAGCTK